MNCTTAKTLISLECDNMISPADRNRLQTHLESCRPCAIYRDRLQQSLALVDAHSLLLDSATTNKDLDALVRRALSKEPVPGHRERSALERLHELFCCYGRSKAFSMVSTLSMAVVLLVVSFVVVDHVVDIRMNAADSCRLGHLESFRAETDSEGRVYATLIDRNSMFSSTGECPK